jgi:antitoxin (DNA-binding transcriptional repressor) of toxin-antitoxin stability system
MYIVHMKRVTASEARRNWFRLLDEVAAGETVVIERHGQRILIRRENAAERPATIPDYTGILAVREPDRAAEWGWEWAGEEGGLEPKDGT